MPKVHSQEVAKQTGSRVSLGCWWVLSGTRWDNKQCRLRLRCKHFLAQGFGELLNLTPSLCSGDAIHIFMTERRETREDQ